LYTCKDFCSIIRKNAVGFLPHYSTLKKLKNSGVIALDYVQNAKNLADPFTKGLSRNMIDLALREMGLRPTCVAEGVTQPM
jgi:hypothetical protein